MVLAIPPRDRILISPRGASAHAPTARIRIKAYHAGHAFASPRARVEILPEPSVFELLQDRTRQVAIISARELSPHHPRQRHHVIA
eukprot:4380681-Pyramimonas_sp.AAC.1